MINITTKELEIESELKRKIKTQDDRIEELEYDLNDANVTIDELEDKLSELQKIVEYFKELWKKFIEFLQNKFFSTNKYDDFINNLYDEDILDNDDLDIIQTILKTMKKMNLRDNLINQIHLFVSM